MSLLFDFLELVMLRLWNNYALIYTVFIFALVNWKDRNPQI